MVFWILSSRESCCWNRPGVVLMPAALYVLVLSALQIGLVLNLYWEMIRYIR